MRYSAYPKYKASGIAWLGDVPATWELRRSDKYVLTDRVQVPPEELTGRDVYHYSIPSIQETGHGLLEPGEKIASAKQLISAPVLLVSKLNPRKATVCLAAPKDNLTVCSTEFIALRANGITFKFLYYLVLTEPFRQRLDSTVQSVTRSHQRANPEHIYRFWAAWPSSAEQVNIANFLDRKTAEIDTLVLKKRALIEKLHDKRSALISRTVTCGLPPEAARAAGFEPHPKLKQSGIEWLGEVPEHWDILRVATISTKITNGFVGPTRDILVSDGIRYLQSLHIKENRILFSNDYFVEPEWSLEHSKSILREGDVLIVQTGDIGQVAYVPEEFSGCNCHALIIVSPRRRYICGSFLSLFLNSAYGFHELKRIQTGALHPHLNCGLVRDIRVPVPPVPEQRAIADFLDYETAKIDSLISKIEQAIDRLQEYRTALITAAVTGKIDVRETEKVAGVHA